MPICWKDPANVDMKRSFTRYAGVIGVALFLAASSCGFGLRIFITTHSTAIMTKNIGMPYFNTGCTTTRWVSSGTGVHGQQTLPQSQRRTVVGHMIAFVQCQL